MANPITLTNLSPREAVVDALYRAVLGLDTNDAAMFESAWAKDKPTFVRGDTVWEGMETINKNLFDLVASMDTHHTVSNIRVDMKEGGSTASMTTYTLAQHHRAGEGMDPTKKGLMGGTTYFVDLVKDSGDGLWKMKKWELKLNWCDGDISVITG